MKNNLQNNTNATINAANGGTLKPETLKEVQKHANYYGLDYTIIRSGILVHSGSKNQGEYWVIKLNKSQTKTRILFHQNHQKNHHTVALPCAEDSVNNDIIQQYFHKQEWNDPDLRNTFRYISNHGNARKAISAEKLAVYQLLNMKAQQTQRRVAYA